MDLTSKPTSKPKQAASFQDSSKKIDSEVLLNGSSLDKNFCCRKSMDTLSVPFIIKVLLILCENNRFSFTDIPVLDTELYAGRPLEAAQNGKVERLKKCMTFVFSSFPLEGLVKKVTPFKDFTEGYDAKVSSWKMEIFFFFEDFLKEARVDLSCDQTESLFTELNRFERDFLLTFRGEDLPACPPTAYRLALMSLIVDALESTMTLDLDSGETRQDQLKLLTVSARKWLVLRAIHPEVHRAISLKHKEIYEWLCRW